MRWIGLTGGIATGKSTVSQMLRADGFDIVDADQLAREVVAKGSIGLEQIVQAFGPGVLSASGELERKALGQLVFNNPSKLAELERITHPLVRELAEQNRRRLESLGRTVAFYDVPLLFEKKMESLFEAVIVVFCSADLQVERLMKRDAIDQAGAHRRIAAQIPIDEKVKLSQFTVRNDGDQAKLALEVKRVLSLLKITKP